MPPIPPVRIRFRQSFATVAAVCVAAVGALAVAGQSWAYTPVLLIPAAGLWWAVRTGVDVDADGLTIRRALGATHFAWADVEGYSFRRGRVLLHLTAAAGGRRVALPAVTPATLPRLITALNPIAGVSPAEGGTAGA